MHGSIYDPRMEPFRPRVLRGLNVVPGGNSRRALAPRAPAKSAVSREGRGLHTLRGGVDPGDVRFRDRVVRVVHVWKDF